MSCLANAIDQLPKEHGKTAAELAEDTRLTPAQISRWNNGVQISIKPKCLIQLAEGFPEVAKAHARLLFATLNDAYSGPGKAYIKLTLSFGAQVIEADQSNKSRLTPNVQKDLEIIASGSRNRKIRDVLHAVANLCDSREAIPLNLTPLFFKHTHFGDVDFSPASLADEQSRLSVSQIESPIKSAEARKLLCIGPSLLSAIKRKMGLRGKRRVLLSDIKKWRLKNPNFRKVRYIIVQVAIAQIASPNVRFQTGADEGLGGVSNRLVLFNRLYIYFA